MNNVQPFLHQHGERDDPQYYCGLLHMFDHAVTVACALAPAVSKHDGDTLLTISYDSATTPLRPPKCSIQ